MSENEGKNIVSEIKKATTILSIVASIIVSAVGFGITWGVSSERLNNKVDRADYLQSTTTLSKDIQYIKESVDDLKKNTLILRNYK